MRRWIIAGLAATLAGVGAPSFANDFPTSARVEFVESCMRQHDGKYEYLYKCSCALDHMAGEVPYEEFVDLVTAARTVSLRGALVSEFRHVPQVQDMARKFVGLQKTAYAACNMPEPVHPQARKPAQ